ncbi:hypothetical protein Q3G72_015018 [Acer saccharum]|nr:hypothetical protein Q3G72_015018 [Acer saccharum]
MELFSAWLFQNITNHPQYRSTLHNKNKYRGIEVHHCLVDNPTPKFIWGRTFFDHLVSAGRFCPSKSPPGVYHSLQCSIHLLTLVVPKSSWKATNNHIRRGSK